VLTSGGAQIVVSGRFGYMNGTATSGVAALDPVTGASRPFAVGQQVSNQGDNSSINSLSTDGTTVWMSGYDYYGPGNLEGAIAATAQGGDLVWMADCHGDTYSTFPRNGALYVAAHPHQCQNIGGFPEVEPRFSYYAVAYTQAASRTNRVGDGSFDPKNFVGRPAPEVTNWYPRFYNGTYTGQGQAGWSVTGNDQYVVYGGEFPGVNNLTNQGLVRFAVPSIAPNKVGPTRPTAGWAPTAITLPGGDVRVSWPTVSDRDNQYLTYRVYRDGASTPVFTSQPEDSTFFRVRTLGFRDVGQAPGSTHRYQVRATDPTGNVLSSDTVPVTVSSQPATPYAAAVRADAPTGYWPLESLTGTTSYAQVGFDDVTVRPGMTVADGSPLGSTSLRADGTAAGRGTVAPATSAKAASDDMSLELWFATTSTTGGRLAGYGNDPNGNNGAYDRMLFMDDAGILVFGVFTGNTETIVTQPGLNDGAWHHVVASLSPAGMTLYVDGFKVGAKPGVTAGQPYAGYWQLGGGNLGGWPANRSTDEFTGQLSQFAVYPGALSQTQVRAHYTASGRSLALVPAPTDPYGAAVAADQPSIQWRLDDAAGASTAAGSDERGTTGRVVGDVGRAPGVTLPGTTSQAYDLGGRGGYVVADRPTPNPTTFTTEAWFSTTSTDGGRIIGLGNTQDQNSGNYDRFVYMRTDGTLRFGIWSGQENLVDTATAYNDGDWHHVVATFGPAGMALYVDGGLVGTNGNTSVVPYDGQSYWRVGSDTVWGGTNTTSLNGLVDEAAVYDHVLSAERVAAHWAAASQAAAPTRPSDAYGAAVWDSAPSTYWRMDETTGTTARSTTPTGSGKGSYTGGATLGAPGPSLYGSTANTAVAFDGQDDGLYSRTAITNPTTFSTELWFASTSTRGGKLIGFGSQQTGWSGGYDRHVYLQPDGTIAFGTWTGQMNLVVTDRAYNDGSWHQVVATMGADGMRLYVDGVEVGSNPNTGSQDYTGYWRVGGDSSWNGDGYVAARIDEVAVYTRALTGAEVAGHWLAAAGPVDTAPTAAFTTVVDGLSVAFDGSGSTDAEGAVTHRWDFGDGTTATGATAQHTYAAAGQYPATLVVTDGGGQTSSTTMTVTVTAPPPNVAPTADFTAVADDLVLSVDASASGDVDGTIASYRWDFGDGGTATGRTAQHTYASAGSRTVTLTVTDDDGARTTVTRSVTTTAPNQLPTASFTTQTSFLEVAFDGGASADADGTVRSWAWSFGDGTTASGATVTHTFAAGGSYPVQLTVTDDRGGVGTSTQTVVVAPAPVPNRAPTASFTASVADLVVALDGRASADADGTVTAHAWDFGDGTTGTGATTSHRYATAGTWTVTLVVTDDKGATATTTGTVTTTAPANVAPTAAFTVGSDGLVVSVDGSGSTDPDGTVRSWAWTFGDGGTATGRTAQHTYTAAGSYPITLTVTDDRAGTASVSTTVQVTAVVARDAFGRTVASGWGTADLGGVWTTTGTASVNGGVGQLVAAAGKSSTATLAVNRADVAVQATVQVPQTPTGGGTYASVAGQRVGSSEYRVKVWLRPSGASQATLVRVVNNVETTLATYNVPGTAPGTAVTVRFDLSGAATGTTTLRAAVWAAGTPAPSGWSMQATDSTAGLQRAGAVGVTEYVSGSATAPSTVRVDDLWVGASGTTPAA